MSTTGSRRGKAMPTDGPTPKFLYTIIKQLDLKSVDWNLVASQLEISNGHAARMRYSRFRQQMEGITTVPRPRQKKNNPNTNNSSGNNNTGNSKGTSKTSLPSGNGKLPISPPPSPVRMKQESNPGNGFSFGSSPFIKNDPFGQNVINLADIPQAPPSPSASMPFRQSIEPMMVPYPMTTVAPVDLTMDPPVPTFPSPLRFQHQPQMDTHHVWAPVKSEPGDEDCPCEVLVKMEIPYQ